MYIQEISQPDTEASSLAEDYIERSTLITLIKKGMNVEKIQDPLTMQYLYGYLKTDLPEDLALRLARNVQGFKEVLGLEITEYDLDAIILFLLKTDKDLFSIVEETVYEILENQRPLWLSPNSVETKEEGTMISLIGLPGVGKSWLSTLLAENITILDNDQFRFNVLGRFIYEKDGSLFYDSNIWRKSQHLYGSEIYKIYNLTYRAVAQWLKLRGLRVVTTSLATQDETDHFILLNPSELDNLRSEKKPENLRDYLNGDIEMNLRNAGYPKFASLFKRVKKRVEKRALDYGNTGLVSFDKFEPLPLRQTYGANPKLDDVSIALIINWFREDIEALERNNASVEKIEIEYISTLAENNRLLVKKPSDTDFGSYVNFATTDYIIQTRLAEIRAHSRILEQIKQQANNQLSVSQENLRDEVLKLTETVLCENSKELDLNMQRALAYVLVRELLFVGDSIEWPKREEVFGGVFPELISIPHPLHSTVALPILSKILCHGTSALDWLCMMSHDQFEIATDYRSRKEVGASKLRRSGWKQDVLAIWPDNPQYSRAMLISASLLTERVSELDSRAIRNSVDHLYQDPESKASQYFNMVKSFGLTGEELERTGRIGPTSFSYLALKYEGITEIANSGHYDLASALLKTALLDRIDDTLLLARYFGRKLEPAQLRFKILSYTGRLLSSLNKLREVYVEMDDDTKIELSDAFRTFVPLMFDIIEQEINPALGAIGQFPIEREEVFEFYWKVRVPLVLELEDALIQVAANHTNEALSPLRFLAWRIP